MKGESRLQWYDKLRLKTSRPRRKDVRDGVYSQEGIAENEFDSASSNTVC